MNSITEIAELAARDYITPEDVSEALKSHAPDVVRRDLCEVLGKQTQFGAEDKSLCAFVAFRGTPTK